jgi:hypothetical protein
VRAEIVQFQIWRVFPALADSGRYRGGYLAIAFMVGFMK